MKEFKDKPKQLLNYVREKQKVKSGISRLENEEGNVTEDEKEAANVLNRFFQSVFTEEPDGDVPGLETNFIGDDMTDCLFSEEDVAEHLKKLKPDKSPGLDGIHPQVLSSCAEELATPLYIIFRKSLDEGCLPRDWKAARVVPIYKKGARKSPGNYRPVSLTSVPCKVFESILRKKILEHVDAYNLLSQEQHGFMKGRSCLTNLLETFEEVTSMLDQGGGVDMIYLDYSKAFDSVPHRRLIAKLQAYGIKGKVSAWVSDFLIGRRQQVKVGDAESDWADVISGVPQGSVLGPILFVIYINDLPENVQSEVKMFADDTKVFRHMRNPVDQEKMQADLDSLQKWSETWLLRFNASKCKRMHMGGTNQGTDYNLGGEVIPHDTEEKDLGVIITEDGKSSSQCAAAASKAMTKLRIIKRTFKHFDVKCFTMLYRTYIRPHLEYSVQAWSPHLKKDIAVLEKVQRRATKLIPSIRHMSYPERLQATKLYSLEQRRVRGDMIETFKILNGLEGIEKSKLFKTNLHQTNRGRGHSYKLYKPALCKGLNCRSSFFSIRVISEWNNLPARVVESKTTNQFKGQLDKFCKESGYGAKKA